jgi:uncharacterized membrane protein YtjA (UPF0391 family)
MLPIQGWELCLTRSVTQRRASSGELAPFREYPTVLRWALIFLVISIIAGLFGFAGISVAAAGIAKILFFIFVVVFLVFLILGLSAARRL